MTEVVMTIDWKRVYAAVRQEARRLEVPERVEVALQTLQTLECDLGVCAQTRPMCVRLGRAMLARPVRVVVPVCPDYAHNGDVFTFTGMGDGVSLTMCKYLPLLDRLTMLLGELDVQVLYADVEVEDPQLCRSVGVDRGTFLRRVQRSAHVTQELLASRGWSVQLMSEAVPNWEERARAGKMRVTGELHAALDREELYVRELCARMNPAMTQADRRSWVAHSAAQYLALATWAVEQGALIVDATSGIRWYLHTDLAFLHYAVRV